METLLGPDSGLKAGDLQNQTLLSNQSKSGRSEELLEKELNLIPVILIKNFYTMGQVFMQYCRKR